MAYHGLHSASKSDEQAAYKDSTSHALASYILLLCKYFANALIRGHKSWSRTSVDWSRFTLIYSWSRRAGSPLQLVGGNSLDRLGVEIALWTMVHAIETDRVPLTYQRRSWGRHCSLYCEWALTRSLWAINCGVANMHALSIFFIVIYWDNNRYQDWSLTPVLWTWGKWFAAVHKLLYISCKRWQLHVL